MTTLGKKPRKPAPFLEPDGKERTPWEDISDNLIWARTVCGYDIENLSKETNISIKELEEYEVAPAYHPTLLNNLTKLANAFGIAEEQLEMDHWTSAFETSPPKVIAEGMLNDLKNRDVGFIETFCSDIKDRAALATKVEEYLGKFDLESSEDLLGVVLGLCASIVQFQRSNPDTLFEHRQWLMEQKSLSKLKEEMAA